MWKLKVVVLLVAVVFALADLSFCASDLYWVSYSDEKTPCSDVSVMQIDALGQITIPPKPLNLGSKISCSLSVTALSHAGTDSLILWLVAGFGSEPVFKSQIEKNTLAATHTVEFPLLLHQACCLQAPSSPPRFFAAVRNDVLLAYGVNADGSLNGSHWRLMPRINGFGNGGSAGVTADGRMAYGATIDAKSGKYYVQFLREDGRPTGNPTLIASGNIRYTDVSNVLPGGRRLAVYWNKDTQQLLSQMIDAATGSRLGSAKVVGVAGGTNGQNVALDPEGRFVVFTKVLCAKSNLFFQALDPTGASSGSSIELLSRCGPAQFGVLGINLLKE